VYFFIYYLSRARSWINPSYRKRIESGQNRALSNIFLNSRYSSNHGTYNDIGSAFGFTHSSIEPDNLLKEFKPIWSGMYGQECMVRNVWSGMYGQECMVRNVWSGMYGQECMVRNELLDDFMKLFKLLTLKIV